MVAAYHPLCLFQWELHKDKWEQLEKQGLLDVSLLGYLWPQALPYKAVLLGLMEKLDLLCPLASTSMQVKVNSGLVWATFRGRYTLVHLLTFFLYA